MDLDCCCIEGPKETSQYGTGKYLGPRITWSVGGCSKWISSGGYRALSGGLLGLLCLPTPSSSVVSDGFVLVGFPVPWWGVGWFRLYNDCLGLGLGIRVGE